MKVRPLDKYKKICYNKRKRHFYRSGKRGPIGLIFIKKYDIIIMGENNNKPIGLHSKDLHMENSRSAFRDILGHMADRFRLKKIPYGVYRSETRSAPALGGPFIWFGGHMGVCLGVPAAPLRGGVAEERTISGKCPQSEDTRNLRKKLRKGLTK